MNLTDIEYQTRVAHTSLLFKNALSSAQGTIFGIGHDENLVNAVEQLTARMHVWRSRGLSLIGSNGAQWRDECKGLLADLASLMRHTRYKTIVEAARDELVDTSKEIRGWGTSSVLWIAIGVILAGVVAYKLGAIKT